MFEKPALSELLNESDVEQKFVYPLLVSPEPTGFGLDKALVHTKQNIRKLQIGKGTETKIYFPDYLITMGGLPLAIGEVKAPGSDLKAAFREARLYAAELNALFPTGLNPLTRLFSTDGSEIAAGHADQAEPTIVASHGQIDPHSPQMHELQALLGHKALERQSKKLFASLKSDSVTKPRLLLGGIATQVEEVSLNSFGATISADFAHIFNPVKRDDRAKVARYGYVNSPRRQRYVGSIDRVIRASASISETAAVTIENTSVPRELISSFERGRQLEHQVLLLIGSVGSGKSTFIDYLQEVALPENVRSATIWVHLNMNYADISQSGVFNWVRHEIVAGLRDAYSEIDFDSLDILRRLYSIDVNRFTKGVGQLYRNAAVFDEKLADVIQKVDADIEARMLNMCRFCGTERGKLVVVVMDNCDKRLRDEQLLMFQVAEWLQKSFRVLVILPMREETFDNHRNEPPLDTALKDMVFRIEPAAFQEVLTSRIQMAKSQIMREPNRRTNYYTPNGMRVEMNAKEQASYLDSILRSVFEHSQHIRDLIVGLAGRNLRLALEIFMEFCTSGYLTEDHIFQMKRAGGQYVLPLDVSMAVLLRRGRRFYDSDHTYIKNICSLEVRDERPNFFGRLLILSWLSSQAKVAGPRGLIGYFPIADLQRQLSAYGIDRSMVRREVEYLAAAQCVISEDFRTKELTEGDLVCIGSAGVAHLNLTAIPQYWAAVAEDTWFSDRNTAQLVADRISRPEDQHHIWTVFENAGYLLDMLQVAHDRELAAAQAILDDSQFPQLADLSRAIAGLAELEAELLPPPWVGADVRFGPGEVFRGHITNVKDFGVFVELEPGLSGLAHVSRMPPEFFQSNACMFGNAVQVRILEVKKLDQRIALEIIGPSR